MITGFYRAFSSFPVFRLAPWTGFQSRPAATFDPKKRTEREGDIGLILTSIVDAVGSVIGSHRWNGKSSLAVGSNCLTILVFGRWVSRLLAVKRPMRRSSEVKNSYSWWLPNLLHAALPCLDHISKCNNTSQALFFFLLSVKDLRSPVDQVLIRAQVLHTQINNH